jgi:hypothetical protein
MNPQTAAFLDKSRELLVQAGTMLEAGLPDAAGRTAYLAGLHAAQALIFERGGRIISTLLKNEPMRFRILRDALLRSAPQDEACYFKGLPHPEEARRAVSKGADIRKPHFSASC